MMDGKFLGVVIHVLDGDCVIFDYLLVEFLHCLEVGLLLCLGVAQVSNFVVVFAFLKGCLRVDVDVYPILEYRNTYRTVTAAVVAPTCDFGQENDDVRVNLLEMRIVLPDFLLMDEVDKPGSLVLMDLFEQIVDVQPQSAWIGENVGQQLSWIFSLEPLEVKLFLTSIAQLVVNQSIVQFHSCAILILKLVELLQLSYWSLFLFFQAQIKILLEQGCLKLVDLGLMRCIFSFDMLTMAFFDLL